MNIFQKIVKVGEDKVIHFLVCLLIAAYATRITYRIIPDKHWISYAFAFLIGWVVSYGVGMWKESFDRTHGGSVEQKDLNADSLGALAGAFIETVCLIVGL